MANDNLKLDRVYRVLESLDDFEEKITIDQKICVLETAKQMLVYQEKTSGDPVDIERIRGMARAFREVRN
jgi:hypothetical protein